MAHPRVPGFLQPNLGLWSFSSENHLCGEDVHKSSKRKVPSHSCFLALAQMSPGWLNSPVIHVKTLT